MFRVRKINSKQFIANCSQAIENAVSSAFYTHLSIVMGILACRLSGV